MKRLVVAFYLLILFFLTIYSYSQIDLNLTLSSFNIYQQLQNFLIWLGYFNRPLSTLIYILLLLSLFLTYYLILKMVKKRTVDKRTVWMLILFSCLILFFSYSAFSHDLFNYMFDARIVTKYGLNPYSFKALDFPDDLWTRFMHWTHRTYPYGPLWLFITLPFSFLGFQKFTLTYFLFKLLFLFSYLISSYLVYLIVDKIKNKDSLYALAFFAFNPLILVESLVSPHNDSLMLLFALFSIYFFISKKYFISSLLMLVSTGVKFVTLPLLLIPFSCLVFKKIRESLSIEKILAIFPLFYFISIFPVIYLRELLPWYAIPFIGLSVLVIENKFLRIFNFVISFILLLKYISFLYYGEWTKSSYNFFLSFVGVAIFLSVIVYLVRRKGVKYTI